MCSEIKSLNEPSEQCLITFTLFAERVVNVQTIWKTLEKTSEKKRCVTMNRDPVLGGTISDQDLDDEDELYGDSGLEDGRITDYADESEPDYYGNLTDNVENYDLTEDDQADDSSPYVRSIILTSRS